MHPLVRSILIFILGIAVGIFVNMGLLMLSPILTPLPEGMDRTNAESIKEYLHLIGPKYYVVPFLADALSTLIGAWVVASLTISKKINWTVAVGIFFMIGGVTNLVSMSSPLWFTIFDISLAYLPMSILGYYWRKSIKF